jgi:hypothetical protein
MMAVANPNTAAPVAELLGFMTRLADLLAQETALLRAGRVGEIAPLHSGKIELSARYAAAIKALDITPGTAPSLPAAARSQLAAAGSRLAAAAQENADALRIGGAATRLLLEMVIESVEAQRCPLSGYTARLAPARAAPLLALALDRHL